MCVGREVWRLTGSYDNDSDARFLSAVDAVESVDCHRVWQFPLNSLVLQTLRTKFEMNPVLRLLDTSASHPQRGRESVFCTQYRYRRQCQALRVAKGRNFHPATPMPFA